MTIVGEGVQGKGGGISQSSSALTLLRSLCWVSLGDAFLETTTSLVSSGSGDNSDKNSSREDRSLSLPACIIVDEGGS